jgi:hypothetical protein
MLDIINSKFLEVSTVNDWFQKPGARYTATMLLSLFLYAAVLVVSISWLKTGVENEALKIAIAVMPVVPALGIPLAVIGYCRAMDEFQLRIQLESLAFGFAAAAIATFTYGFLQNAGLPDVSWVWVWPVMAVCWMLGQLIARRRYR